MRSNPNWHRASSVTGSIPGGWAVILHQTRHEGEPALEKLERGATLVRSNPNWHRAAWSGTEQILLLGD